MKIEFYSLGELDEFVQYLFNARAHAERIASAAASIASETLVPDAHLTPAERAAAQHEAHVAASGALLSSGLNIETRAYTEGATATGAAPLPEQPPVQHMADKPPRKRRTKAEIEADKLAAAAHPAPVVEMPAPSDAQATAATSPLAGANPFDASTSNEPAATAALNEAPAGTTGTLSALGSSDARADAQAAADGLGADVDPQSYIALRVAEMGGAFDAREHMKKCVEFIGALGKARYDAAFDLAGTSRSVATYTPADCAKHIAALEYLQLSGKGA